MDGKGIAAFIESFIMQAVTETNTITKYRDPLVGFASADNPQFSKLQEIVHPSHKLPKDLIPDARSVVSFFLPFKESVVDANAKDRERVAKEWVEAYIETNALIVRITDQLIEALYKRGVGAAAEPPTGNFDRDTLISPWAHKSVAVIAGLGSFGLHHLVITDVGCAGRFGSLVVNLDLPFELREMEQRCLYFVDGSCLECVLRCPAGALDPHDGLNKQLCWGKCQRTEEEFKEIGRATVCGKCAVGICALASST